METRPGKKWQNLIRRCCPYCNGKLEPLRSNTSIYQCRTPGCEFTISEHTIFMILSDETHIMRRHLTTEDKIRLDRVLGTALTEETEEFIN